MIIKRLAGFVLALMLATSLFAGDAPQFNNINVPATMANGQTFTTNATAGNPYMFYNGQTPVRIWASATGVNATTNGALAIKFSVASGTPGGLASGATTNEFDNAAVSNIKLTMSSMYSATNGLSTTNTVSDWFVIGGACWIRLGQVENTFAGPYSNLTIRIGYVPQH